MLAGLWLACRKLTATSPFKTVGCLGVFGGWILPKIRRVNYFDKNNQDYNRSKTMSYRSFNVKYNVSLNQIFVKRDHFYHEQQTFAVLPSLGKVGSKRTLAKSSPDGLIHQHEPRKQTPLPHKLRNLHTLRPSAKAFDFPVELDTRIL